MTSFCRASLVPEGFAFEGVDASATAMLIIRATSMASRCPACGGTSARMIIGMAELLGHDSDERPEQVYETALAAAPGDLSRMSRPCQFVEWLGYVPVLIKWGGFIERDAGAHAIVPDLKLLSSTGFVSIHAQCLAVVRQLRVNRHKPGRAK